MDTYDGFWRVLLGVWDVVRQGDAWHRIWRGEAQFNH